MGFLGMQADWVEQVGFYIQAISVRTFGKLVGKLGGTQAFIQHEHTASK